MTLSEVLAAEVLELRAERAALRNELRRVRRSRDLWRSRFDSYDAARARAYRARKAAA